MNTVNMVQGHFTERNFADRTFNLHIFCRKWLRTFHQQTFRRQIFRVRYSSNTHRRMLNRTKKIIRYMRVRETMNIQQFFLKYLNK